MSESELAQTADYGGELGEPGKIEQAKQEWENAVDSMPQLICVLDAMGRIIRVNRTSEQWGLGGVSEARGSTLHKLLHPACSGDGCLLREFWPQARAELLHGRRVSYEADDPILQRYIEVLARRSRFGSHGHNGKVDVFAIAIVEDITESKRAEAILRYETDELGRRVRVSDAELKQAYEKLLREIDERTHVERARARLLEILERTPDFVGMVDFKGTSTYLNSAARNIMHIGEDEDISALSIPAFHPPQVAEMLLQIAIPAAIAEGAWAGESTILNRAGKEIPTSQVIIAHKGPTGNIECLSTIIRDMTQRKMVEEALRASESGLRELSAQLLTIQESERKRIATDLHDGLGQSLSALRFCVEDALRLLAEKSVTEAEGMLDLLVIKIQEAVGEVRRITMDLRPSTLDDLGIVATISWFAREYERIYRNIAVEHHVDLKEKDVALPLKTTIFRILQEAMNNVAKHACASMVRITLHGAEGRTVLAIEDNGAGFNQEEIAARFGPGKGFGLANMRDRAALSGGEYVIRSTPGHGTVIRVSWPAS